HTAKPMKKIEKSHFSETVPVVRLYLPDLQDLIQRFAGEGVTVTIQHAEAQYDSLEELREHVGGYVRTLDLDFRFRAGEAEGHRSGHCSVDFKDENVRLFCDRHFELQLLQLIPWLRQRKRLFARQRTPIRFAFAALGLLAIMFAPSAIGLLTSQ